MRAHHARVKRASPLPIGQNFPRERFQHRASATINHSPDYHRSRFPHRTSLHVSYIHLFLLSSWQLRRTMKEVRRKLAARKTVAAAPELPGGVLRREVSDEGPGVPSWTLRGLVPLSDSLV